MQAAVAEFEAAGDTMLTDPHPFMFGTKEGDGDLVCCGREP